MRLFRRTALGVSRHFPEAALMVETRGRGNQCQVLLHRYLQNLTVNVLNL